MRNNAGSFAIRGAGAYRLVAALFANLDGERTIGDICGGLPDAARRSVLQLMETLARNGFVREVTHDPEPVPTWMQERYPAHLTFLEHHADRPVTRMMRVRSTPVVCIGGGLALRSLLGALAEFGVARLLVVTTTAGERGVADVVADAHRSDPRLRWRTLVVGDELDVPAAIERPELAGVAHVLVALDGEDGGAVGAAQRRMRAQGRTLGVLGRCGDFVVAMPPVTDAEWCWQCVRRSIAARVTGDGGELGPTAPPATIGALHLVQHLFAALAGVQMEGADAVTSVEPVAPIVRTHVIHRHPLCDLHDPPVRRSRPDRTDEPVRPDIPAAENSPDLVAVSDRIVAATSAWTDQVAGPLLALGEDATDQVPLSASTCRLADPASTASAPVTRLIVCRAVSPREARNQVVLFALEWLAGRVLAMRGALPAGHVLGAGWSPAEAWYRARLGVSLALPPGLLDWRPATPVGNTLHEFLGSTLAADDRAWQATAIERLPTGFTRAWVRTADDRWAGGVGLDERHALGNALLRAVVRGLAGPEPVAPASLAPPVGTWTEALAVLDERAGRVDAVDVTDTLPFLGADAHVWAVSGVVA